ncbi:hypothetical protein [Kluyvera sichuanensis]|uniref:hypothetical protein n=1 Tax=Kluyvera sichuanensis TaxID=2725494 RepID=UPI002FD0DF27
MKNKLFGLVVVLATLSTSPAYAISAHYRAQLEKSGCTQVTDGNGTCDIHKTKAQNQAAARAPSVQDKNEITQFLNDSVIGQSVDDAYPALEGYGWESSAPLVWLKGNHKLKLKLHGNTIIEATLVN